MTEIQQANTVRIAKNTLFLYFRQILIMLVSLYTVRIVLNVLGAEDYGIYNVVAGMVTMLSFLSGTMTTASQRFFCFELGKSAGKLEEIFSVTLIIYIVLALVIVLLAETLGLWFVCKKFIVPDGRFYAVFWIYQCVVASFLFSIAVTPYMSAIIAHENMNVYAYMSVLEAVLKLLVALILRIVVLDKLILYGILLLAVNIISTSLYRFYCRKNYKDCRFQFYWNTETFREMFSYAGWNLLGGLAWCIKNQGIGILLNQFFGSAVNAARAIAYQVYSVINTFSQNFSTAAQPQIVKVYSSGNNEGAILLAFNSMRYIYLLSFGFVTPLICEISPILHMWLKDVPSYTEIFTKLLLIDATITSVTYPIGTLIQATGKIKVYQIVISGILISIFPISYIVLQMYETSPTVVFVINILLAFCAVICRLVILSKILAFSLLNKICIDTFGRIFLTTIITLLVIFLLKNNSLRFHFIYNGIAELFIVGIFIIFIGMKKKERKTAYLKALQLAKGK